MKMMVVVGLGAAVAKFDRMRKSAPGRVTVSFVIQHIP